MKVVVHSVLIIRYRLARTAKDVSVCFKYSQTAAYRHFGRLTDAFSVMKVDVTAVRIIGPTVTCKLYLLIYINSVGFRFLMVEYLFFGNIEYN
jgi:hypothetical protein